MQFCSLGSSKMVLPLPSSRCLAEGNEIYNREILSGHFWYTIFWVPDPPLPPFKHSPDPREVRDKHPVAPGTNPRGKAEAEGGGKHQFVMKSLCNPRGTLSPCLHPFNSRILSVDGGGPSPRRGPKANCTPNASDLALSKRLPNA